MPAVSQADLERWKAFGGSYQENSGRKTYTAPSGKKLKSWKEAEKLMKQDSDMENTEETSGAQKLSAAATKKRSRPPASDSEVKDEDNVQTGLDAVENTNKASGNRSRKRAATEGKNYNELEERAHLPAETVQTKEDSFCKTEKEALEGTAGSGPQQCRSHRRLKLCAVVTSEDDMMQLQQVGQENSQELFMQGAVYPSSGKALKAEGRRLAQRFGPIKHWKATYKGNEPELIVSTELADYTIMTCAPEFREHYNDVREQVTVCHCVVQTMKGKDAKDAEQLSLESVMAAVSRAKAVTGYATVREAVLLNGSFILAQVPAMQAELGAALNLDKSTFIRELRAELRQGPPKTMMQQQSIGIRFHDKPADGAGSSKDVDMSDIPAEDCDTQYARRVQAKMDAAKYLQAQRGGAKVQKQGTAYIKISEEEIADDYPLPMQYEPQEEEMDELVVNGDEEIMLDVDPECLPTMVIDNFAVYNADGFMSTLELLPMWQHVDPDVDLFGSGIISQLDEDDTARDLDLESRANCAGTSGASTSAGAGCSGETEAQQPQGMHVCLSQIKEWHLEVAADMVFIVVRTDCAWYKVRSVLPAYEGWFRPILKVCSLAAHLLSMIVNASRSSKISLQDVVNNVSALKVEESPSIYVSSKKDKVERFMLVHGQIILNQFKNYPVKAIQQCAFVFALQNRMQERKHSKLFMSKRKFTANMRVAKKVNPMRNRAPKPKLKPMTATATTLVKAIWADYFNAGAAEAENAGDKARPVEDDENAEDEVDANVEAEVEQALADDTAKAVQLPEKAKEKAVQARKQRKKALPFKMQSKIKDPQTRVKKGHTSYKQILIGDTLYQLGDVVILQGEDEEEEKSNDSEKEQSIPGFAMLQYIGEDEHGDVDLQMRMMQHGKVTVLGDTASDYELFMAACEPVMFKPEDIRMKCDAERLKVPHGPLQARDEANAKIRDLLKNNAGKSLESRKLLYRMQYRPKEGMFCEMPANLELGSFIPAPVNLDKVLDESQRFTYKGNNYGVGCFVYIVPEQTKSAAKRKPETKDEDQEDEEDEEEEEDNKLKDHKPNNVSSKKKASDKAPKPSLTAAKDGPENSSKKANKNSAVSDVDEVHENLQDKYYMHKYTARDLNNGGKGDLEGLVPYTIAQILQVETKAEKSPEGSKMKKVANMKLRLFARPEDVDPETAYKSNMWTLYATDTEVENINVERLRGRCHVALDNAIKPGAQEMTGQQLDVFVCEHTLVKSSLKPKPKSLKVKGDVSGDIKLEPTSNEKTATSVALRTLDIFSGCGGLSEGMHQAGAAVTEWAIEYWTPAAQAFKENNRDAFVYNGNCNVLLHRAMVKAGMEAQCDACAECVEQSGQFNAAEAEEIPLPGQVEFICGGPPCQGYSGMNRFNKGNWSMVQNSMVMSYLSYADFYRPRYWLLENVRNFVSHNKSHTFRLTLRTLLDMGYQVRFGVLNAGNFGVSQSRKRTFIWAAAPEEELPDWPRSLTVFKSPQLCIKLPDGESYTAVSDGKHARLRAVTVRDTIGDMPAVENGESTGKRQYSSEPVSHFQQQIRGEETELKDHICKTMNELNMRRCELVPKNVPGADWRSLVLHVEKHPEDALFNDQKVVPWCLPNTADRHNGWRGLFGRLNWEGHFPTSVTDPNPMGKVGQVFHPEQDRIVSVRECARAQGFPDRFLFAGSVHDRHKEVGNAVPPPLAAALGRQLRKKLVKAAERRAG